MIYMFHLLNLYLRNNILHAFTYIIFRIDAKLLTSVVRLFELSLNNSFKFVKEKHSDRKLEGQD